MAYRAYQTAAISMSFRNFEGYPPIANPFKWNLSYSCVADIGRHVISR